MVLSNLGHGRLRRAAAIGTAGVLLLAACGGGGDDKVASKGGDDATTTTSDGEAATPGGGDPVDAGASDGTTGGGSAGGTAGGATGDGAAVTTTTVKNVPDSTPGLPAAGQYRFRTTGTTKFGANPEQPVDVDSTTAITHLGEGMVRQTSEDQTSDLQWKGAQVLLHTLDLTRPGFERHFEARPPVQYAPRDLAVGQTWQWKMTATNLPTTIHHESRVDRLEDITVNGKSYNAIVVVTRLDISGDVTGTIDLTQWVDTAKDLPVRIHAKTNIVTFGFTSDTTSDFTGFTAA